MHTVNPLPNVGLSCFANASIQCIWNCKNIKEFIENHADTSITCGYICKIMIDHSNAIRKLINHLEIPLNTEFDAGEFLLVLFDKIISETKCNYTSSKSLFDIDKNVRETAIENHYNHWSKNDFSKLVDIIFGQQYTLYEHNTCGYKSINISYFNQLVLHKVDNGKHSSIGDMLHALINDEDLDTSCSKCKKGTLKSLQYISLWPKVLIFSVNSRNAIKKLNGNLHLDNNQYTLNSVICHLGTENSGHYYAIIHADNTWIDCNDMHINKTLNPCITPLSDYYIVFYVKTT
jgi:ubiquitin C-terminal hydrolase